MMDTNAEIVHKPIAASKQSLPEGSSDGRRHIRHSQILPGSRIVLVGIIGFATLSTELLLTKALSFVFWNHLVYLVVSIALLGYGISSTLLVLNRRRIRRVPEQSVLSSTLTAMAVSLIVALTLIAMLQPDFKGDRIGQSLAPMLVAYLALLLPFLLGGIALIFTFQSYPKNSGRLYAGDLFGAGLGCASYPVAMTTIGPTATVVIFAGLLVVAALWVATERARGMAKLAALVSGVTVVVGTGVLATRANDVFSLRPDATKSRVQPVLRSRYAASGRLKSASLAANPGCRRRDSC
jgi:hypothetical protein